MSDKDPADDLLGFAGGPMTVAEPAPEKEPVPAAKLKPAGERLALGIPLQPETPSDKEIHPSTDRDPWFDIQDRLAALERFLAIGDPTAIISGLEQMGGAIAQLQQRVAELMNQRAAFDVNMERQTRFSALDLAIKASPTEGSAEERLPAITALAGGFLLWLKAMPVAPQHQNGAGSDPEKPGRE